MRRTFAAVLTGIAMLVAAPVALGHISIHPNTVPAQASATLLVRVPGEESGAHVTRVDMQVPAGFTEVETQPVPGWSSQVIKEKVVPPIQTDEGPVSEQVGQVVWTWQGPLGKVEISQFMQFPIATAIPAGDKGKALEFKTVETYSNGKTVHWIEPALDAEHPAPRINVTAPGGVLQDVAGKEAGPEAQSGSGAAASSGSSNGSSAIASSGASKGLGVAALILGALGLVVGSVALVATRRRGRTAE